MFTDDAGIYGESVQGVSGYLGCDRRIAVKVKRNV